MLKSIIFDAYGTLISTGNGSIKASQKILEINNRFDISASDFYANWKKYHKLHIETLENFVNEESIFHLDLIKLYNEYEMKRNADIDVEIMLNTLGNRTAFIEVPNVLKSLSTKVITCIGSTTDTKPLIKDLDRNNLKVNKIFTSEMLKIYKPNVIFYDKILQELNIDSSEVLFVGDSIIDDILGPQSVGIKACWVNRKRCINQTSVIPDFEIPDLTSLNKIVDSLLL